MPGVTPPLAQSTNSFKSEVEAVLQLNPNQPVLIERCLQLKQFLRIKTTGQSKQEFPTRETLELGPIAR